jgi:DNA-binding MarR family transcriptional regulator
VSVLASQQLGGAGLAAWRGYIQSHAAILRELDADLLAAHGIVSRDYEVLLYLSRSPDQQLAMSALAQRTMLTRSGVTRLIDGLVASGLIQRVSSPTDGPEFYAQLTSLSKRTPPGAVGRVGL